MQYEIRSVDPIINDRTIMVEVAYWYFDTPIGNRQPDFVEHIVFHDIPVPRAVPVRNEMNQLVKADGTFDAGYVELDGEWIGWEPAENDPNYQWIQPEPEDPAARIEEFLKGHAPVQMVKGRSGVDMFPTSQKPKVRPGNANIVAKNAKVRALKNKRGKI